MALSESKGEVAMRNKFIVGAIGLIAVAAIALFLRNRKR